MLAYGYYPLWGVAATSCLYFTSVISFFAIISTNNGCYRTVSYITTISLSGFLFVPGFTLEIGTILLHTVPLIYEKYDDQIDAFAEKAEAEFKKQYAVFSDKVLSKLPKGLKDKLA